MATSQNLEPNYGNRPPEKSKFFANLFKSRQVSALDPAIAEAKAALSPSQKTSLAIFHILASANTLAGVVLMMLFAPAHSFEAFFYSCAVISPFAALFVYLTWNWVGAESKLDSLVSIPKNRVGRGYWCFGVCLLTLALFWTANVKLDTNAASEGTFTVLKKYETHGRHGTLYHASIWLPEPPMLGITPNPYESVGIPYHLFEVIIPGSSRISLWLHPGFFHLPWYEERFTIVPPQPQNPSNISGQNNFRPVTIPTNAGYLAQSNELFMHT